MILISFTKYVLIIVLKTNVIPKPIFIYKNFNFIDIPLFASLLLKSTSQSNVFKII